MRYADLLRAEILERGDLDAALVIASEEVNTLNARLNRRRLNPPTSLLARAFTARAILMVASEWLAMDLTNPNAPLPEAARAMRSLVDDPPPDVEGFTYKTRRDGP